ncbi:transcriptional regulator with PAS, ATPase and Fis domain [Rhodobium orientis]|uniref:Sigma-54 factor interaction domain-containing protein n=1 Tax=Rhodobium orientis TaxID=34017 RepID=A0A327JJX0_9HYPH|nr:sigma 54-interacting transcriptional regulator [Rhodobium orientis]MBB4304434.1 transcriptional regulator with PAS, ATPase and Fis domain [Rhodobium orientis]MBK5949959.1 hypothetical protein [Rhodobium orientis]RAI25583.1 hypothetical protein CH339_17440 [Rhodobium orientis]
MREIDDLVPLLEAIVSYIDEGVLLTDRDGTVLYQNPAAAELLVAPGAGPLQSLADIRGVDLKDALDRVLERAPAQPENAITPNLIQFDMRIKVRDEMRDLEFHCCRACDTYGNLRLVILRDKTDERRLETLLSRSSGDLVTKDPTMMEILERVERVAPMQAPVLIQGETGTGKTHIARLLHRLSNRSRRPFVEFNCASTPVPLIEAELFGHARGAFGEINGERAGKLKAADTGTLFLDEVSALPAHLQTKLLKALQDGAFEPVGSDTPVTADVRMITASNRNLRGLVEAGEFRADLYYRLAVFPITVPPIRERPGDIPLLLAHFCDKLAERGYPRDFSYSPEARRLLIDYPWPGNVREMETAIEHALICCVDNVIVPESLPHDIRNFDHLPVVSVKPAVRPSEADEKVQIQTALARAGGNKSLAAKYLGIDRTTLWRKMRRLRISERAQIAAPEDAREMRTN